MAFAAPAYRCSGRRPGGFLQKSMNSESNHTRFPGKPPRLETVFQQYRHPVFFITFNTASRQQILDNDAVHASFLVYARKGAELGRAYVGRYVIMPDHIHVFIAGGEQFDLGMWVRGLKRAVSKVLTPDFEHWQPGFFDHLMRSDESLEEKWNYVKNNPVRAGLVATPEQWPFQGEIERIHQL